MEENENSNDYKNIYLGAIILLVLGLGAMTFFWSSMRNEAKECAHSNLKYQDTLQGMNKMLKGYIGDMSTDLKSDFKKMLGTYDRLIEKDASKADSLNAQKIKIQSQIEKIEKLQRSKNFSAAQVLKLKEENESLRGIMRSYVVQIDSLNTLNLELELNLTETTNSLNRTTEERDQFKQEVAQKTEQVKKGSKLSAYNFNSGALKSALKAKPTTRARQAAQLQATFTISENPIASSGKKIVYMQIEGPSGKTFQRMTSYLLQTEDGSIAYTEKKEIDYQNKAIDMSIYYDIRDENLAKGNYKVNIYCGESLIGSDSFTLK
jgi:DNA repair ATPase RecN